MSGTVVTVADSDALGYFAEKRKSRLCRLPRNVFYWWVQRACVRHTTASCNAQPPVPALVGLWWVTAVSSSPATCSTGGLQRACVRACVCTAHRKLQCTATSSASAPLGVCAGYADWLLAPDSCKGHCLGVPQHVARVNLPHFVGPKPPGFAMLLLLSGSRSRVARRPPTTNASPPSTRGSTAPQVGMGRGGQPQSGKPERQPEIGEGNRR